MKIRLCERPLSVRGLLNLLIIVCFYIYHCGMMLFYHTPSACRILLLGSPKETALNCWFSTIIEDLEHKVSKKSPSANGVKRELENS